MKLAAVDSQSFQAKHDRNLKANGSIYDRKDRRANVDALINLDDNAIKMRAYQKTMNTPEEARHRRLMKALLYAFPVITGISSGVLSKPESKFINKNITGFSAKLLNGTKAGLFTAALLGAIGAVFAINRIAAEKSSELRQTEADNPVLTKLGLFAASFAGIELGAKYLPKLAKTLGKHIKAESIEKITSNFAAKADTLNNSSFIKALNNKSKELAKNGALKTVGETILGWAPTVTAFGALFSMFNHRNDKNREFVKNYSQIKDLQTRLAQARIRELSLQNDFLMADAKNREDVKILKDNLADLPDEVKEKVAIMQQQRLAASSEASEG